MAWDFIFIKFINVGRIIIFQDMYKYLNENLMKREV